MGAVARMCSGASAWKAADSAVYWVPLRRSSMQVSRSFFPARGILIIYMLIY